MSVHLSRFGTLAVSLCLALLILAPLVVEVRAEAPDDSAAAVSDALPQGVDLTTAGVLTGTPTFVTQPSNQSVFAGQTATFTVLAAGSPPPNYQWQLSTDGGTSFTNLTNTLPYSGVTTVTLTVTNPTLGLNAAQYRAVASNGATATSNPATLKVASTSDVPLVGDIDGDGIGDLIVWRPTNGTFYWLTSSTGYSYVTAGSKQWGTKDDVPLVADMDGDAKSDLIVWRPGNGTFFWLTSSTGYSYVTAGSKQWGSGALNDVPLLRDFDGDRMADLTVWRPGTGTFFWLMSSTGFNYAFAASTQWGSGALNDVPLLGDMDGDAKADLAVWRPGSGTFFWLTSSTGYSYASAGSKQWGSGTLNDIPRLADMDGDGKTDLVVWRPVPGTFFWLTSSTGYSYASAQTRAWGSGPLNDIPLLGPMDTDGRADLIVWRPGNGTFFWLTSSTGYSYILAGSKQWGSGG